MTLDEIKALEGQRVRLRWTNYRLKGARWRRWIWARWPRGGRGLVFRPCHNEREGVLTHSVIPGYVFGKHSDALVLLNLDGKVATTLSKGVQIEVLP